MLGEDAVSVMDQSLVRGIVSDHLPQLLKHQSAVGFDVTFTSFSRCHANFRGPQGRQGALPLNRDGIGREKPLAHQDQLTDESSNTYASASGVVNRLAPPNMI
jgi:hypothetical protein